LSHNLWNVTSEVSAGEQKIGMPVDDLLPPEARLNYSTEERSNSALLTKILAGKLPISRAPAIEQRQKVPDLLG